MKKTTTTQSVPETVMPRSTKKPKTNAEVAAPDKPTKRRKPALTMTVDERRTKTTVGLDVGERHIQLCEIDPDGVISEARFVNSSAKLREVFEGKKPRRIIIEVGSHTRWIWQLLGQLGHEVIVVDPRRVKLISGSIYKDDRVDAQTLAMLGVDAPRLLKTVPMREIEYQRTLTLVRARACAVKGRTRIVNSIRGMIKPYGHRVSKDGKWTTFVTCLWQTLEPELLRLIEPLLVLLEAFNTQIARYDNEAESLLPKLAPKAVHLSEIPGVGALTVLYFVAVISDPMRFPKTRDVGAYLGLCRRRDDSGDYKSELGITKAGDRYMRALLANCAAHILGPFGKDTELRRWASAKAGEGSRAEKKKAKIALARKLAVLMLTLWKSGQHYERFHNNKDQANKAA